MKARQLIPLLTSLGLGCAPGPGGPGSQIASLGGSDAGTGSATPNPTMDGSTGALPRAELCSSTELNLGHVAVGSSRPFDLPVFNCSGVATTVSAFFTNGGDSFSAMLTEPIVIAPYHTVIVPIVFAPHRLGGADGDLVIQAQDDGQVARHVQVRGYGGDVAASCLLETTEGPCGVQIVGDDFFPFPSWRLIHDFVITADRDCRVDLQVADFGGFQGSLSRNGGELGALTDGPFSVNLGPSSFAPLLAHVVYNSTVTRGRIIISGTGGAACDLPMATAY